MALPEGNYFCHVTNQAIKKTSTGKQFVVFSFEVVAQVTAEGGRRERSPGAPVRTGELIFWLTDKAFDNALRDIQKILGGEISSFSQIDPRHPNTLSVIGKELELSCRQEEYKGQMQTKWSLPRDMGKPLTNGEMESLDERLAAKRQAAKEEPLDLATDSALITDEDIPF